MARTRKQNDTLEPTGTVQARRKNERQRQREAQEARRELVAETKKAQKATADLLAKKPTDSRNFQR